jgi:hypothetical protein
MVSVFYTTVYNNICILFFILLHVICKIEIFSVNVAATIHNAYKTRWHAQLRSSLPQAASQTFDIYTAKAGALRAGNIDPS